MNAAKSVIPRDLQVSVKPDFTDRIIKHRRILGERMMEERQINKYATIRYDKLIVEEIIFKYDDFIQDIVCIGKRNDSKRQRGHAHGQNVNNNSPNSSGLDRPGHIEHDVIPQIPAQGNDWPTHNEVGVDD